jgi:hypothetical protein
MGKTMHSPALALNWQIWGRHRWGLVVAMLVVAVICTVPHAVPRTELTANIGHTGVPLIVPILMPYAFVMLYLAYVFSLAELGNRASVSGFPLWMLTLPVRTPWLVIWPMLSGCTTVTVTWLAVGWFALNKVGLDVPLIWPALGLACTVIWIQAIDWSPLGSIIKALVAIAFLAALWSGLLRPETHNAAFAALPAMLLLGFVAGSFGVSRLRRGGQSSGFMMTLRWRIVRERIFATPQRAQFWLEWRRNGSLLPLLAACWIVLVVLGMALSPDGNAWGMISGTPFFWLIMAPVAGLFLGKPDVWSREVRLPIFAGTRPLTCGDMVLAKLRMTALSLLAAWLVLGLGLAIWLAWSGQYASLWQTSPRQLREEQAAKLYATLAASFIGLFGFQLFLMAGSFVVSLTGRFWIMLATLFIYFCIPTLLAFDALRVFKDYVAEAATTAVVLKLLLAGWAFWFGYRRGLISGTGIAGLLAAWLITVGCVFLVIYLAIYLQFLAISHDEDEINALRDYVRNLVLIIVLLCPLFRIALAPIALTWNQHR